MLQQNLSNNKEAAIITRLHAPSHGSLGSQERLRREEGAAAVAGIPEERSPVVGSRLVLAQHQIQADQGSRPAVGNLRLAVGTPGGHSDLVGGILVARDRLAVGNQVAGRSPGEEVAGPVVGTQAAAGVAGLEERSGHVDLAADQEEH